jgi:prepilin-type N-terminal cleavage/methylation domain-containing protein
MKRINWDWLTRRFQTGWREIQRRALVAQVSNLPYRRFPIGRVSKLQRPSKHQRGAGWKPCDTADWKSALPTRELSGPGRRGFTLIELMVVVGILALLAALLLPALGKGIGSAKRTHCLSNQRQWYMAFVQYSADNNDWIARESYGRDGETSLNNWSQVADSDSADVWYNALAFYLPGQRPASAYASNKVAFYNSRLMIHCPSAQFPSETRKNNAVFALFSMGMNSQLIPYGRGPTIRLTQIETHSNSTKIPIFVDALLEGEKKVHKHQESTHLGQPAVMANRFSARHVRTTGNVTFADGRTESMPGSKVVQTDDNHPLRGGPILPPVDIVWDLVY